MQLADASCLCGGEGLAGTKGGFSFPRDLLGDMDIGSAVDMLKSMELPAPLGGVFSKAVDAAMNAKLLIEFKPILVKIREEPAQFRAGAQRPAWPHQGTHREYIKDLL